MNFMESVVLGLLQGLTEFLPVSSSGHLILIRAVFGWNLEGSLSFDVLLHLATLLAIIIFFWGDLSRLWIDFRTEGFSNRSSKLVWAIVLGAIPAGLAGFFMGDWIEKIFRDPTHVAYALIGGSIVFFFADLAHRWGSDGGISLSRGFAIGVFQAFALIPGVSRSGVTISGGLFAGLSREEAIRFTFLLGIPTIAGAALKTLLDIFSSNLSILSSLSFSFLLGFLAAFLSGLWAVKFLVRYLSTHNFNVFIVYRLLLAVVILLFI